MNEQGALFANHAEPAWIPELGQAAYARHGEDRLFVIPSTSQDYYHIGHLFCEGNGKNGFFQGPDRPVRRDAIAEVLGMISHLRLDDLKWTYFPSDPVSLNPFVVKGSIGKA